MHGECGLEREALRASRERQALRAFRQRQALRASRRTKVKNVRWVTPVRVQSSFIRCGANMDEGVRRRRESSNSKRCVGVARIPRAGGAARTAKKNGAALARYILRSSVQRAFDFVYADGG